MAKNAIGTLRDELEAAVKQASTVMTLAETENRELTADERKSVDDHLAKARDVRDKIERAENAAKARTEIDALLAVGTRAADTRDPAPRGRGTLGSQFVASDAFEYLREGRFRGGSAWASPAVELHAATLTEGAGSGGALVFPTERPGILELPFRRLVVSDLLAQGTTDSNLISYMVETIATNAAAYVLEAGLKPESTLAFANATEPIRKVATWLPVTEEMLMDSSQIRSYIDARLRLFVELAEENGILNGDGIGANMLGLHNRVGLATAVVRVAPESNADAIFRQIMNILTTSFLQPDGIVLHPMDWAAIVLGKDANGQYYGNGPFSPIQTPVLWGLPVATTPAEPTGTGLVGAFKTAAQLWKRTGIVVQASNSHADYFIRNMVAIRAEQREGMAVYRPGAIGKVTALQAVVVP